MDAARDLLVELGPDGLTVDAVVARSGVAKSTVYRHWKTRDDLVADVFAGCMPDLQPVSEGCDAVTSLRHMAHQTARALADPRWQRLLPALMVLKTQSDALADLNDEMKSAQHEMLNAVLRRCVEDGVLDAAVMEDPDRTGLVLVGPLLAVALVDGEGPDEAFVDEVVDRFIRAYAPGD
jgi:AcrR family transcriptional regulator